jgi:hypothetical protein
MVRADWDHVRVVAMIQVVSSKEPNLPRSSDEDHVPTSSETNEACLRVSLYKGHITVNVDLQPHGMNEASPNHLGLCFHHPTFEVIHPFAFRCIESRLQQW